MECTNLWNIHEKYFTVHLRKTVDSHTVRIVRTLCYDISLYACVVRSSARGLVWTCDQGLFDPVEGAAV